MYVENLVIPVSNVSLVAHKQNSTGRSLDTNHTTRQRPDPLRPRKGYGVGRRISCSHVKCEEKPQYYVRSNRDDIVPCWVQGLTIFDTSLYELTCLDVRIINSTDSRV